MTHDFLIIGQGLAGTLIGYRLAKAGKSICFVDAPEQTAASSVAAGIINPITGRRFVKSWRIDELIPEAQALYAELEDLLGIKLHYHLPLVRTIHNRGDQNSWDVRSGEVAYVKYLDDEPELGALDELTEPAFNYVGVRHSSRVDIGLLTQWYRALLTGELAASGPLANSLVQKIILDNFDYAALEVNDQGVSYRGVSAKKIIFCEGWRVRHNPWFNYLPHRGAKGQVLIGKLAERMPDLMFKHHVFLVPQGDKQHWIGATTEHQFEDDSPTPVGKIQLLRKLDAVMAASYEIVDHRAAVRPTVKDRRPLVGVHPAHDNLFIFNGLGTKGTSLAPLCSRWLAEYILAGKSIPQEVDIRRFA